MSQRLTGNATTPASTRATESEPQNRMSPTPACIALGMVSMMALSITSIMAIEKVSVASAIGHDGAQRQAGAQKRQAGERVRTRRLPARALVHRGPAAEGDSARRDQAQEGADLAGRVEVDQAAEVARGAVARDQDPEQDDQDGQRAGAGHDQPGGCGRSGIEPVARATATPTAIRPIRNSTMSRNDSH